MICFLVHELRSSDLGMLKNGREQVESQRFELYIPFHPKQSESQGLVIGHKAVGREFSSRN